MIRGETDSQREYPMGYENPKNSRSQLCASWVFPDPGPTNLKVSDGFRFSSDTEKSKKIRIFFFPGKILIFVIQGSIYLYIGKRTRERKEKWQNDRTETMFHKIMGNLEKKQAIGGIISYFFPYYFNCHAKKSTKIQRGENIWNFFPLSLYFFPLRPCNNCSFTDDVLGGKYGKREIKSYNVS